MDLNRFVPTWYIPDFSSLNMEKLSKKGIRFLMVDIDNTLITKDEAYPTTQVRTFLRQLATVNIRPGIISNNTQTRVATFCKELDCPYEYFALKPLSQALESLMKKANAKVEETAILGDQLLTDIWGGNRLGIMTILTTPLSTKDNRYGSMNRKVENVIFRLLEHQGKLNRGDYYDQV